MRIIIAALSSKRPEGGVANVVYNSAEELRNLGHHVDLLFREDILPDGAPSSRFEVVSCALRLSRILQERKNEFDVAIIHAPIGFAYGYRRSRDRNLPPYVMMIHGIEERRVHTMEREQKKGRAWFFKWKNRAWQRIYHMRLYRWCIVTADYSIVINQETWSMLQLKYNRELDRVWYVPNGVELPYFTERQFSDGPALRLLFVGSWLDHKGVYYLRDSFEALANKFPGLRLTIAGCSGDAEMIRNFFPEAVRDRLDIFPFIPRKEMPAVYAEHDIFTFPSLFEGLPVVLLEAMASGMAVVTTETCGMNDIVEDDFNGLLVKPADTDAFVAATEKLILSPELRARLGRSAQLTMERHTWKHAAIQLEKVLLQAAKATPGSVA